MCIPRTTLTRHHSLIRQCQVLYHKRMCIPRTTLTRHHSLISSFVSCPVCFPCSFAPCYEVLMMPEPFEEFRYVELVSTVCSQLSCVCGYHCHLTVNFSSALRLELSVSNLLELCLVTLKIWFRTSLVEFV